MNKTENPVFTKDLLGPSGEICGLSTTPRNASINIQSVSVDTYHASKIDDGNHTVSLDKIEPYVHTLKKFNWHTYLRFNKDLIPHIKSEKEAYQHYERHGANEGRLRSVIEFYNKFPFFNSE